MPGLKTGGSANILPAATLLIPPQRRLGLSAAVRAEGAAAGAGDVGDAEAGDAGAAVRTGDAGAGGAGAGDDAAGDGVTMSA